MKKFVSILLLLLIIPLFFTNDTKACNPGCTAGRAAVIATHIARNAMYVGIAGGVVGVTALGGKYIGDKLSGVPKMSYNGSEWVNLSLYGVKISYKKSELNSVTAKLDQSDSLLGSTIQIAKEENGFINVNNEKQTTESNNIYLISDSEIQNKSIKFYMLNIPKELKNSDKLKIKATFSLKNLDGTRNLSNADVDFNLFKNQNPHTIVKKLSSKTINSSFKEMINSQNSTDKNIIQKDFIIEQKSVISGNKPVILAVSYKNPDKKINNTKCIVYAGILDIEKIK